MTTLETTSVSHNRFADFATGDNDLRISLAGPPERSGPLGGQVALITGMAPAIRHGLTAEMAKRGATTAIVFHPDECRAAVGTHDEAELISFAGDLTEETECENLASKILDRFGVVDILIHTVNFRSHAPTHLLHRRDWDAILRDGLGGAYNITRALINPMRHHGRGRVIFVMNTSWQHGPSHRNLAGESTIRELVRTLALENADHGITVNAIATGIFESPQELDSDPPTVMIPAARLGRPEELARTVAFLASDDAAYITGQTIAVDGGLSL